MQGVGESGAEEPPCPRRRNFADGRPIRPFAAPFVSRMRSWSSLPRGGRAPGLNGRGADKRPPPRRYRSVIAGASAPAKRQDLPRRRSSPRPFGGLIGHERHAPVSKNSPCPFGGSPAACPSAGHTGAIASMAERRHQQRILGLGAWGGADDALPGHVLEPLRGQSPPVDGNGSIYGPVPWRPMAGERLNRAALPRRDSLIV